MILSTKQKRSSDRHGISNLPKIYIMNKIKLIIVLSSLLIGNIIFAQENKTLKKGENYFNTYSYSESIKKYESVTDKTTEINRRLAESYYKIGKFSKSEEYWAKVVTAPDKVADDVYRYAAVLAMNKKYQESEKWMDEYNKLAANDKRGQLWAKNKGFYEKLQEDKGRFTIESLNINTEQQDFGTSYFKDKIVFASTRQPIKMIKKDWNWNELPFLDIYTAQVDSTLQFKSYQKFHNEINKKYHEGPASFNEKVDFMAFTRNNYKNKSQDGIRKLQLFTSEFKDGKWQEPKSLPFNSNEYSVGHASLTLGGDTMYFASDMPGGHGGVDIYRIYRKSDGNWTEPENLGDKINTEGNEMFPYIHPDGLLFFASDGLLGLGGLDVFVSKLSKNGFSEPENVGVPVNGSYDDFAFILDKKQTSGYFSSNRPGGKGDDDIYLFHLLKPFHFGKLIRGTAMQPDSSVLTEVKVNLYDDKKNVIGTITTTENGKYEFLAEQDKNYSLDGTKTLYSNGNNTANTFTSDYIVIADLFLKKKPQFSLYCLITDEKTGKPLDSVKVTMYNNMDKIADLILTPLSGDFYRDLKSKKLNDSLSYKITTEKRGYLTKIQFYNQKLYREGQYNVHEALNFKMNPVEEGSDLSKIIDVKPIYFDLGKHNIRPDAAIELDKIVKVMNENPNLEIELGSHTDCRGTAKANMALSDRRAKSSASYIQARITNPKRIYGKGYGESLPINKCECEGTKVVPCTEEEHQQNRRTEFKIIKM
jgi:outer membrane protein OmpA-like peptidoglycan-associated protein/tetratricopeptide (TPR) repeat protein